MANPETCSHPNQIRGADGVLRCLSCGAEIVAVPVPVPPEERVTSASGRRIGFDAEKPRRRPARKKAE